MTIIPLKANLWTTISRVIICGNPIHDKSGDPARTRRNQEYGKENQKPQQDDLHVHKQVAQQRMETLHQWKGCATLKQ